MEVWSIFLEYWLKFPNTEKGKEEFNQGKKYYLGFDPNILIVLPNTICKCESTKNVH